MKRRIVKIDESLCNGCGACAEACHEGASGMVNGKAKLLKDDYCDGLGDCLPACPTGAISFEEREAAPYDEEAVQKHINAAGQKQFAGCPGSQIRTMAESCLSNWPVQIKLAPINAPYFDGADLLIAADCTAFAYGAFHEKFIKDHITLIGCPKLDDIGYSGKLTAIIGSNNITSVTLLRMEVPCCGGLEFAARKALESSRKDIPFEVVTIGINGEIL